MIYECYLIDYCNNCNYEVAYIYIYKKANC